MRILALNGKSLAWNGKRERKQFQNVFFNSGWTQPLLQSMMFILAPIAIPREVPKCTLLAIIKFSSFQVPFALLTHNCIVSRENISPAAVHNPANAIVGSGPFITNNHATESLSAFDGSKSNRKCLWICQQLRWRYSNFDWCTAWRVCVSTQNSTKASRRREYRGACNDFTSANFRTLKTALQTYILMELDWLIPLGNLQSKY